MKLTVIIVNYNVRYFLEQCLHSVHKAMRNVSGEVYVVDNNSVDGSVEMVAERFPWVKLIANRENTGFSKANNQAMRIAEGEYVLLLNPDTVVEEDTFEKVVRFMDEHPDAGGLGVKMVDGKGIFLPESKRGLPTPETSFYKIFGLSRIFPRSAKFNRYHLGHLNSEETHEVEILSGAFMLMRKKALDTVGLLDEAFFMYGEDVDLSWRIIQGGWKNYYFPGTTIIHYKGESTKKGSLNYVFVFYNAMAIFARKHYSEKHAAAYNVVIKFAIWMRATVAVLSRFFKRISLPLIDAAALYLSMLGIKDFYAVSQHKVYDDTLVTPAFLSYIGIWLFAVWLGGGYDRPLRPQRVLKPIAVGSAFILIAYALLPENLRFSRALILLSAINACAVLMLSRLLWNVLSSGSFGLKERTKRNVLVVGSSEETKRVIVLLEQIQQQQLQSICIDPTSSKDEVGSRALHLSDLEEIIRIREVDQVIYCARDLSSSQIIASMSSVEDKRVEFKIVPPESLYIIGSGSIETAGDAFMMDVNSVHLTVNRRKKRIFDVMSSALILGLSPLLMFLQRKPLFLLVNCVKVLAGSATWVSYSADNRNGAQLPRLKSGVLPVTRAKEQAHAWKMDVLYAKDYRWTNDLKVVLRDWQMLGA